MIVIFTLGLWLIGFGLIVWAAGWIAAVGVFFVLWANNMQTRIDELRTAKLKAAREKKIEDHIKSDPERFGSDPWRKDYQ